MTRKHADGATLVVLHAAFALTGVLHAIGGALLPSLAPALHMTDRQSGSLFLLYFLGTALGALLCVGRYARMMAGGFLLVAAACAAIAWNTGALVHVLFLALGIGVGVPMSAVSMFAGRKFGEKSAAPLTFLNFSWSIGALLAPLLAAQILLAHTYRTAYLGLAAAAVCAAACALVLEDPPARVVRTEASRARNVGWIALFAVLTFLEVGVENTTATWLATYAMRSSGSGAALAAASSSLYWCGFLASRGLFSFLLLRLDAMRVLRVAVVVALAAAALLVAVPGAAERGLAMLVLGASLAPVFPLMLSRFFARARNASDSRWVLAVCGFGGSATPWLTGVISGGTGSLRWGLLTVPAELLVIAAMLMLQGRGASERGATE